MRCRQPRAAAGARIRKPGGTGLRSYAGAFLLGRSAPGRYSPDHSIPVLNGTSTVGIGAAYYSTTVVGDYFDGLIDELSFYDRALSQTEIHTIFSAAASGKCVTPVITRQPENQIATPGASVALSVSARGSEPLAYQWLKDGIELAGETSATLTIAQVQPEDFGVYVVRIASAEGWVLSQEARLTLAASPVIVPGGLSLSTFSMAIPTELGPVYDLEYKTELNDAFWTRLTSLAGTGGPVPVTDIGLTNASKFYRVRVR